MAQTRALINRAFILTIADIIIEYFEPPTRDTFVLAEHGCYELCMDTDDPEETFYGACKEGYINMVRMYVSKEWSMATGLMWAWAYGHDEIADYLISLGIESWNGPLYGACFRGDRELIDMAIQKGATDWHDGGLGACEGGHFEIAMEMMIRMDSITPVQWQQFLHEAVLGGNSRLVDFIIKIKKIDPKYGMSAAGERKSRDMIDLLGTYGITGTQWDDALAGACLEGNVDNIHLLISLGATDLNRGMENAVIYGRPNIVELMISLGATNLDDCFRRACMCYSLKVVKILLAHGVEPSSNDLAKAYEAGSFDIARLIIDIEERRINAENQKRRAYINFDTAATEATLYTNNIALADQPVHITVQTTE
jgi:hypothetical protein